MRGFSGISKATRQVFATHTALGEAQSQSDRRIKLRLQHGVGNAVF
jgi:hypothetical protein